MRKLTMKKIIVATAILLIAGFVTTKAFAYMSGGYHMGRGYGMMNGNQMGYGMMGGNGYKMENLSAEDQPKMLNQMNIFFASTKDVREQSYQKQLDLNKEYLKADKDQAKIETLQKELFDLSAQFEKERFNNASAMQQLLPDNDNGAFAGRGGGYGGCF